MLGEMRELLRSDVPELAAASRWLRRAVSRSSLGYALLAGIGTDLLAGSIARTISAAVIEIARPEQAPRPYDFQEILGPAAALVVARAAGGTAGALAYVAYSLVVVALGWLGRVLICVGGPPQGQLGFGGLLSYCAFGPLDLLSGAAPLLIGLGIGAIIARSFVEAHGRGANPLLEAAGAHVVPSVVFAFGARALVFTTASTAPVIPILGLSILEGSLAGAVIGLRSASPIRTMALLLVLLIATWLYPLGASQLLMAAGSDQPHVYLAAAPLLDLITIPVAAYLVGRLTSRRASDRAR
jgi:hypothetical protein